MASRSRNLYVGITNNLVRRVVEHKAGEIAGFTRRYHVDRLVYIESFRDLRAGIAREKQIKSWRREKKLALIAHMNPTWLDLGAEWKVGQAKKMQIPRFARDDNKGAVEVTKKGGSG